MGVKKEDFLTYCTFLLYGNINTAPGPEHLIQGTRISPFR